MLRYIPNNRELCDDSGGLMPLLQTMDADKLTITPELLYAAYMAKVEEVVPGTVLTPIQQVLLEEVCEGAITLVPRDEATTTDTYITAVARAFETGQAMLLANIRKAFEGSDADRVTISYRNQAFTFNRSILEDGE